MTARNHPCRTQFRVPCPDGRTVGLDVIVGRSHRRAGSARTPANAPTVPEPAEPRPDGTAIAEPVTEPAVQTAVSEPDANTVPEPAEPATVPEPTAPSEPVITAGTYVVAVPNRGPVQFTIHDETARIARGIVAMMRTVPETEPDTPDTFARRVSTFRSAYDPAGVIQWDKTEPLKTPAGVPAMCAQNAIMVGIIIANVITPDAGIMAVWRAMIPKSRADYSVKRYGGSSWADYGSPRRPFDVPGYPHDHPVHDVIRAAVYHGWRRASLVYDPSWTTITRTD